MTDTLSLGPVLDLIERWQQHTVFQDIKVRRANLEALDALDIPALRALAEQHAAQVNKWAAHLALVRRYNVEDLIKAANFLAAPRREPEAE